MKEATQNTKGAFAIVSVMLLAAAISGASLIRAESSPQASEPHSFIGTTPDASTVEQLPPQF